MRICEDPDILNFVYMVKIFLGILMVAAIIILIVMCMLDVIKHISSSDVETKKLSNSIIKRITAMVVVFLVPTIISFVLNNITVSLDYGSCLDNANREYISVANANKAEALLQEAETNLTLDSVTKAQRYINKIVDEQLSAILQERLEVVKEEVKNQEPEDIGKNDSETGGNYSVDTSYDGYSSTGNCFSNSVVKLESEPDPSCALNFWPSIVDSDDFVYLKRNGKYLGAWPKDYESIPTGLSNMKTYQNGKLIWPVTPVNGVYNFVYEHNGIDMMARFGTPIYSPVSGTLVYSEWGHTGNRGSDETAYSISIVMDEPISFKGVEYSQVFLTHLSGIINRCSSTSSCNKHVEKGELIGFIGNAAGTAETKGWAPHLHMSIYPYGNYNAGMTTSDIEKLYLITSGTAIKAGE